MSNKTQKEYSPMKISLLGNVSEITMGSDSSLNNDGMSGMGMYIDRGNDEVSRD
ncbi:MAG: hypothetical protein WBA39_03105 [Rivularia sp. (in: cyanobacteria)]